MTNVILEGFHICCAVENLRVLRSLLTSGCIDLSESACGLTAGPGFLLQISIHK